MRIKKILASFMSLTIIGSVFFGYTRSDGEHALTASAEEVEITYIIDREYVEITGCDKSAKNTLNVPAEIEGLPVVSIGPMAFEGCSGLTGVNIPDGVFYIHEGAFANCSSLDSLTIPDSVISIGDGAFSNCEGLKRINIPDNVTSIGYNAFYGCSSLTSIMIPKGVTNIGNGAFFGCTDLTEVTLPDSITSIEGWTFSYCESLRSVTIPDSVTYIDEIAFAFCSSLTSITIPESVTYIGSNAFAGCTSLASINFPQNFSARDFYDEVFYDTAWLYDFPDDFVVAGKALYKYKGNDTDVLIPEGIDSIGNGAFDPTKKLNTVIVPESVTYIGKKAITGLSDSDSATVAILNPDCEIYDKKNTIANLTDEGGDHSFNGTICGYDGSTAQAYAEKYGYTFKALSEADVADLLAKAADKPEKHERYESAESSGLSIIVIVLIAVGAIAAVTAIVSLIIYKRKSR